MAGILIALLILPIAAFRDAQVARRGPWRSPVSNDGRLSQAAGWTNWESKRYRNALLDQTAQLATEPTACYLKGAFNSLFLSCLLSVRTLLHNNGIKALALMQSILFSKAYPAFLSQPFSPLSDLRSGLLPVMWYLYKSWVNLK